jgi:hypothetical protein
VATGENDRVLSIAEFTLAADDFPLGRIFESYPEATLELDRVVPSSDTVLPYFWVALGDPATDLEAVRAIFEALPELRGAVLMEDLGERGLFRAEWHPEHMGIMTAIATTQVTVIAASGSNDGWTFELRAEDPGQFGAFQESCEKLGVDVRLQRLSRLTESGSGDDYGLTAEQLEALVLAYEEGYYDDPSATDQESLAAALGITRQALSARLRRGYRNLIRNTIVSGDGRAR